jgi:hypothetical protein
MNAIELLEADHKVVAGLFAKVNASKVKAGGKKELVDITLEGIEEHRQKKMFLKELAALADQSEKFEPKLTVLIEDVEHHVKEEEEEMFPLVRDQFDPDVLDVRCGNGSEESKIPKGQRCLAFK